MSSTKEKGSVKKEPSIFTQEEKPQLPTLKNEKKGSVKKEPSIFTQEEKPQLPTLKKEKNEIEEPFLPSSFTKEFGVEWQNPEQLSSEWTNKTLLEYKPLLDRPLITAFSRPSKECEEEADVLPTLKRKLPELAEIPSTSKIKRAMKRPSLNLGTQSILLESTKDVLHKYFQSSVNVSSSTRDSKDLSEKQSQAFSSTKEFKKQNREQQSEDRSSTKDSGGSNSESEIQYISICDRAVTVEDILKMAGEISSSSKKISIEFCNCGLTAGHLDDLCDKTKSADCQITSFTISYVKNIDELLEKTCFIVEKFNTTILCLEYDGLNDESVKSIQKYFENEKIETLESLDISYNFEISPDGFKVLGGIMKEFNIMSFKAIDCDITDEKLKNFLGALDGVRLNKLNIGRNEELTDEGFKTLAEFVAKQGLNCLEMMGCELSKKKIDVFNKSLPQTPQEPLLKELDVSYNPTIEHDASLGSLVLKCGVTKLSMAGCKLNKEHLIHLGNKIKDHEMDLVNLRDNAFIGQGIRQIAEFGKVKEINICDCMFSAHELRSYREALEKKSAKVNCLHLGDKKREPDEKYIDELCTLVKNVKDVLYLRFYKMNDDSRVSLRANWRNSAEIRLTVGEENEQEQWENKRKLKEIIINPNIQQGEFASLCAQSKFEEAPSCIDQLRPEQKDNVGINNLLLILQCYAELGRDTETEKIITEITHLLMTSTSDVDDVINTANHLIKDKAYFRALVLFRIASDMYTRHPSLSADEIVFRIAECVKKMYNAVKPMIASGGRSKVIALKYGCVYMSEMVENLRAVEEADSAIKAEYVAYCVNWIGNNYHSAGEYEKSIEFHKTGVDIMKRQFGKNASKNQIYGHLLNNLGSSNDNLGRYSIAEEYFIKALDARNNASDFSNEDAKQKEIEITQKNLEITRAKMK